MTFDYYLQMSFTQIIYVLFKFNHSALFSDVYHNNILYTCLKLQSCTKLATDWLYNKLFMSIMTFYMMCVM